MRPARRAVCTSRAQWCNGWNVKTIVSISAGSMVYYFTVEGTQDDFGLDTARYEVYMGRDKHENDPLIKNSHPKNLWFHVDKHSSAHLYLQLSKEDQAKTFDKLQVDSLVLDQIAQLTKANSIKANKLNNITIIYTPVDNLHTDGSMDVGTVTFHNPQKVKRIHVSKKDNAVVNKVNKTKREGTTDEFIASQQEALRQWAADKKQREREWKGQESQLAKEHQAQKERNKNPYGDLFTDEAVNMSSNDTRNTNWDDDFF